MCRACVDNGGRRCPRTDRTREREREASARYYLRSTAKAKIELLASAGVVAVGDRDMPVTWHLGGRAVDPGLVGAGDPDAEWAKPQGALWTAPAVDPAHEVGEAGRGGWGGSGESVRTSWLQWARDEGVWGEQELRQAVVTRVRPTPGAVIVRVENAQQMHALARLFPGRAGARGAGAGVFSWAAMRQAGIDGVHLTRRGFADTGPGRPWYGDEPVVAFNGWSVESAAWLRADHLELGHPHPLIRLLPRPRQLPDERGMDELLAQVRARIGTAP